MAAAVETPPWFVPLLGSLVERRDLERGQMRVWLCSLLDGSLGETEAAAVLIALRMKRETPDELAAAASVLREYMVPLKTGRDDILDCCGTGGDGAHTFNISTTTALVVASAGVAVVKHGNRAISSRSGATDVLGALGISVTGGPEAALESLAQLGVAFCHAGDYHPAIKRLAGLRRLLGVRTIFNCLGPLTNPAGAAFQLLGVGQPAWLDPMAEALAQLGGTRRAFLVSSHEGLDEVSLSSPTAVREVVGSQVRSHEWNANDFGLEPCRLEELKAEGPQQSARIVRAVLEGTPGAAYRVVLANAAAALLAVGRVAHLRDGVELAAATIRDGEASALLARLIERRKIVEDSAIG